MQRAAGDAPPMKPVPWTECGAVFDTSCRYRYRLWRAVGNGTPALAFVMLNPSAADATRDDATIRRCWSIACRNGYARLEVVNLFAWRARSPNELSAVHEPIGPLNDAHIAAALRCVEAIVAAWGNHGAQLDRDRAVARRFLAGRPVVCLGTTLRGQPRHPLYVPTATPLRAFKLRR